MSAVFANVVGTSGCQERHIVSIFDGSVETMGINAKIWSDVDQMLGRSRFQEAIDLLESQMMNCETNDELCRLSRKLAHLYRYGKVGQGEEKSNNYALLAGQGYVKAGRLAPAVAVLKWLEESPNATKHIEQLQSWILSAFSSPSPFREQPDDELPIPTPYKEMAGLVSFESEDVELVRTQWQKITPKRTTLFSDLRSNEVDRLVRLATIRDVGPGGVLFREGDAALAFYIVVEGEFELSSSAGVKKVFKEGDFFGEVALLGQMPRTATLKTTHGASVLEFSEADLRKAFKEFPSLESRLFHFYELRLFLNVASRSVFFSSFSPSDLEEIYDFFTPIHVPKDRVLVEQGKPSDRLFLVVKGYCEVTRDAKFLAKIGPGQFVGEMGVLRHTERTATVRALQDCHLLECHDLVFSELVERFPKLKSLLSEIASSRSSDLGDEITDKVVVD